MRSLFVVVVAIGALLVGGCAQWDMNLPADRPAIREFTARDVLDTLGVAQMANAAALEARLGSLDRSLLPDIVQALDLIRAAEAQAKGATAKGITVFVIDDFSYWKFKDGRYHGDYVSATIKLVAPDATVLTCDAWKSDLGECLFDANQLAKEKKIHIVNMSLGLMGTYCSFGKVEMEPPLLPNHEVLFEPTVTITREQAESLEHWVRSLQEKGVVVVSSAGNDGYRTGAKAPGCWSDLRVGAVYDEARDRVEWRACVDENVLPDDRTCWSNYGNVFAPGAVVDGIFKDGISFNGTSVAAPFASGVTALVMGTKKIFGSQAAKQVITSSVQIRDRFNTGLKHVRIDAVRATEVSAPTPPQETIWTFLDKNKNCVIDDPEVLTALLLWITQKEWKPGHRVSDADMIAILHAWTRQSNICK